VKEGMQIETYHYQCLFLKIVRKSIYSLKCYIMDDQSLEVWQFELLESSEDGVFPWKQKSWEDQDLEAQQLHPTHVLVIDYGLNTRPTARGVMCRIVRTESLVVFTKYKLLAECRHYGQEGYGKIRASMLQGDGVPEGLIWKGVKAGRDTKLVIGDVNDSMKSKK
jgi:hypothetical protein